MTFVQDTIVAKFDTGEPVEISVQRDLDEINDYLVWYRYTDEPWLLEEYMHVNHVRPSELNSRLNNQDYVNYHGNITITGYFAKRRNNYVGLALQMERSLASLENRLVRKFIGLGVR